MQIVCDIDGVLTDGKIWVNHQGEIIKSFNNKDIGAVKELTEQLNEIKQKING